MKTINLKDFYFWYTQDEFMEVTDEIEAELWAGKRYQRQHQRRLKRNNAQYSLDVEDDIEMSAVIHSTDNPEAIIELMERHCDICCALNSLPEIQGRRIEAHYFLGMSQQEIADKEGVCISSVNESIKRGLRAMEKSLRDFENSPNICPQTDLGI